MDNASTSDSRVDYSSPALNNALSKFPYTNIVFLLARGSIFIVTKSGYIGLGPLYAEVGEVVSVFNGASTPTVLRKVLQVDSARVGQPATEETGVERWKIVGNCYSHGFMDNEATSPEWREKKETI
jgi:hypothetical protein